MIGIIKTRGVFLWGKIRQKFGTRKELKYYIKWAKFWIIPEILHL